MNVMFVRKYFPTLAVSRHIKGFTLESNLMSVIFVRKDFYQVFYLILC